MKRAVDTPQVQRDRARLWLARAAWLLLLCVVLLSVSAGASVLYATIQVACTGTTCFPRQPSPELASGLEEAGIPLALYAAYTTAWDVAFVLGYAVLAALLFWRRRGHGVARFAAFALLLFAGTTYTESVAALGATSAEAAWLVRSLRVPGAVGMLIVLSILPNGRFVPGWTRLVVLIVAGLALTTALWPGSALDVLAWPLPAVLLFPALVLGAQVFRYRYVSDAIERQQTRWVVLGLSAAVLGFYGQAFLAPTPASSAGYDDALLQLSLIAIANVSLLLLPVSVSIAILRHRLFGIDRILTGTLLYGLLWLAITSAYVALAAGLGVAAGERLSVEIAIAITLAATLMFQPARRWLQQRADNWIYGDRPGEYEVLSRFGAALAETKDPQDLAEELAVTVRIGMRSTWSCVLLASEADAAHLVPIAAAGIALDAPMSPALTAPLAQADEPIGAIWCGPKRGDEDFAARDLELLSALSRQATLALREQRLARELAARLDQLEQQARDLAASRTRLVHAEEAGRRRLERDIHDGVQQQLVALVVKARLARNQLARDASRAAITLADLQEDARQAMQDVRELAQGIHPAVLSDRGLVDALEARCARLPLPVHLDLDGLGRGERLPEAIEGAAYFFVSEGLANTLKHSSARSAKVRLAAGDCQLTIEVSDDGCGFDPHAVAWRGLRGLLDRIEALGGSVRIASERAGGTRLQATLPATLEGSS